MATTTPNFGWAVPTSTDYVKDGATAIETLGDAIDARLGNVGTYPNQIVNVVSGVSRPLPYATAAGTIAFTINSGTNGGNLTLTLPASRFTQAPILNATLRVGANFDTLLNTVTVSTSSVVFRVVTNTGANTGTTYSGNIDWLGIQMTSAAAAG
jgi:hypothetical protein